MRKNLAALSLTVAATALMALPVTQASARTSPSRVRAEVTTPEKPLRVIGLVDGTSFVAFKTDNPGVTTSLGTITGFVGADTALVGIDHRLADGRLYGVGNAGGIYQFERNSSAGRLVHRLTVALNGTSFGVDFNPAVNALRIVSDTGQNLRQSFNGFPATASDRALLTAPVVATTLGVTAAAYTNNDKDSASGTTLYDLNTAADTVVIQSPANFGTLASTGQLGVDAGSDAGFDIYSVIREGRTVELRAYASLVVNGSRGLYDITLFNGKAELDGVIGANVTDIAMPHNQI